MRVRAVEAGDLDAWIEMRRGLWPDEDADELALEASKFIESGSAFTVDGVLVCESGDGGLAGFVEIGVRNYAEGCTSSPVAYVEGWYVTPEFRRSGVGAALIAAVEAWAIDRGYSELASDALLDNLASEKAHRALGFDEVERSIHFRKVLGRP